MQGEQYIGDDEDFGKASALKLKWSLGLNYHIYDGVHNLTNQDRKQIFMPVANQGVIFDYQNNLQRQLQGHCNQISATAYNRKLDIIVTADTGDDSMLVVWDVASGTPRKTIFNPHPNGVVALDVNQDGNMIVTLSKADVPTQQQVSLWRWEEEEPLYITSFMDENVKFLQRFVKFNHNENQFATTGQSIIIFWFWEDSQRAFELYVPDIPSKKVLTQTVFIPNSPQAVTGTKEGVIIVWDISLIMQDFTQPEQRRCIKTVNLMNNPNKIDQMKKVSQNNAINVLKIQDRFLVVGSSNGCVRFYDDQYRIQAWFEDIDLGSIHTISFSNLQEDGNSQPVGDSRISNDKLRDYKNFVCNDFIVVDDKARVSLLKASQFQKIDREEKKGQILLESIVAPIVCSAIRPYSNTLIISCENSVIYKWNFVQRPKTISMLKQFRSEQVPTCVNFSPKGKYMAVATRIGTIHIYEVQIDDWQSPLLVAQVQKGKPSISMQVFSPDSKHLAVMDQDFGVTLFSLGEKNWAFAGKVRVHYAPIRSIAFGESLDQRGDPKLRLFSVAQDMKMAEYDVLLYKKDQKNEKVQSKQKYTRLKLKSVFPIQQQCYPTACIWYPINMQKQNVLLTVNEHYKIKLWSMLKDNMKICKKTCLGPTYGGQIIKLLVLNPADEKNDYQDKYLAYATKDKVVGIIKLPLQGNPNNTMGLIAHPSKITSISSTVDGKLFFTSGADDLCVNMWQVDFSTLAESFYNDPNEDPYPELLEGGPTGQVMSDLKDFFYYSQIRSKDEHTTKARKLDGKVPLQAIANMMRSMGFYPTQKQIENMQNEIRFSKYIQNYKQTINELDLNIFLRLFVNCRPVYGISKNHIVNALSILGSIGKDDKGNINPKITRADLINILTTQGQKMTHEQIKQCEDILLGQGKHLDEEIDADVLCHKILGFEDMEEGAEQEGQLDQNQKNL